MRRMKIQRCLAMVLFVSTVGTNIIPTTAQAAELVENTEVSCDELYSVEEATDEIDFSDNEKRLIITSDEELTDFRNASEVQHYDNVYILNYESSMTCRADYNAFTVSGLSVEYDKATEDLPEEETVDEVMVESLTDNEIVETQKEKEEDDIVIAVLDTGLSKDDALEGKILEGYSVISDSYVDDNGHGTAVAKLIAETATDEHIKILPIKVLDKNGKGTVLSVYLGMKYAMENGADIINMSVSAEGASKILEHAINEAYEQNIPVIVAAGNEGEESGKHFPGNIENAITIASAYTDDDGTIVKDENSNHGNEIDFSANGSYTVTSIDEDGEEISHTLFGTSIATAYVTAYVAMLKAINLENADELSVQDYYDALTSTAVDLGDEGFDEYFGNGYLTGEGLGLILPNIDDITIELPGSGTTDSEIEDWYSDADAEQIVEGAAVNRTFWYTWDANGGSWQGMQQYYLKDSDLGYGTSKGNMAGVASYVKLGGGGIFTTGTWIYWYYIQGDFANYTPYIFLVANPRTGYDFTGIYDLTHGYAMYSTQYTNSDGAKGQLFDCGIYFGNWAENSGDFNRAYRMRTDGETVNLQAQWSPHTCTAYFKNDNGTDVAVRTYTYDRDGQYLYSALSKKGYDFSGWKDSWGNTYSASAAVSNWWIESYVRAKNPSGHSVNMYPIWTPKKYTVNFNKNGGTGGTNSVTATYDSAMPGISIPTKKRTVTCYANSGSINGNESWSSTNSCPFNGYYYNGTKYYNANGTSARTYNIAGGVTMTASWGSTSTTLPAAAKVGYTFDGWYTSANGGTYVGGAGTKYSYSENVNLYAHWTPITYTVVYDKNNVDVNGDAISSASRGSMANSTFTYDKTSALTANAYKQEGYDFEGWKVSNLTTGNFNVLMSQLFDDKATVFNWTTTNHATITLAARWQRIFPNGGDPPDENGSIELNGNGATTTDGLTSITRTNVGWAMNDYTYENHIFGTASDSDYATYVTYNGDRNLVPKDTDTYSDDEYCYSLVGWSVDKNARHTEVGNYVYTPYTTQRIMDMLYDYGGYKDSGEKNTEWSIARVNKIAKTIKTYRDNWICDANKRNVTLYAIWDAYPQITADDVYILDTFLDEATDEELEEKLMSSAKVTDLEDDDAAKKANPKNPEEIKAVLVDDVSVLRQEMQQLGAGGKVTYTIKATDSAGHETTHVVTVHVCETQAIDNHAVVRYIDEENYNKDSEEDGALVENSVWYVNESYRNEITKAFQSLANNTYCQSYFFDVNAIDATQEYIKTKGRANYENEDALATYTNTFLKDATQVATHNKTKVTNLSYLKSAATCTNEAEYYYVCEDCGAVLNETYTVGDKLEHQYKNKTIAPTCEEQGYTLQTCKVCGYQQKINYKDALGHDYVLVDSLEPTCEDKGYELYVCDRCDKEDKREIAATGHDYELVEQAATCTEDGYSYHICKTCDKILETDIVVPATGHTWVNVVNDMYLYNEPTCTDNAVYYQSCKDCGMTKYDYCVANQLDASDVTFEAENSTIAHTWAEIPKDDFVSEKSECGKATVYKISCSECGITKEDYYKNTGTSTKGVTFTFKDEDNIYQHDFTGVDTDNTDYLKTEAVCETPAIYYYYCTHCGKPATVANNNGDELTFEYGKYLGHEYKDGYCIRCEKEEVPGFYDEDGILLCKWDDITVDVTTNYTEDTKTEDLENTISNRLKGTYINDEGEEISLSLTKTIVVPDTITTIGSYAFAGCTASVVKLPKYITSIGDNAFYMAYAMTSIDLPKTVTSIGDKAFYGCQSLTAINIENSSVSIGQEAFDDCDIVNFSDGKTMKHDFSRKKTYVQDDESLENDPYEIYKVSDVTCMAPAVYKYACQYCSEAGEETYEYGIALGYEEHDFVDTIKSEPTCESAEIRYIKCSRCGVIQEGSEYVNYDNPATGHICTKEIDYYNSSYSIYGYCDSCGIAMKNATEAGKNEHVWSKVDETDYTETGDDALYSYDCMTKTTDANGKETYEYAYCDTVKTYTCSDCDIKKTEYWATGKYKKHDEKYCDESKHLLKTVYSEWAMK